MPYTLIPSHTTQAGNSRSTSEQQQASLKPQTATKHSAAPTQCLVSGHSAAATKWWTVSMATSRCCASCLAEQQQEQLRGRCCSNSRSCPKQSAETHTAPATYQAVLQHVATCAGSPSGSCCCCTPASNFRQRQQQQLQPPHHTLRTKTLSVYASTLQSAQCCCDANTSCSWQQRTQQARVSSQQAVNTRPGRCSQNKHRPAKHQLPAPAAAPLRQLICHGRLAVEQFTRCNSSSSTIAAWVSGSSQNPASH